MNQPAPALQLSVVRIIWAALLGSLFIYAWMALNGQLIPPGERAADWASVPEDSRRFIRILGGIAAAEVIGALVFHAWKVAPLMRGTPDLRRAFVPLIVCWAIAESVGIYGLVSTIMTKFPLTALPFLAASLITFLMLFPRVLPARGAHSAETGPLRPQ